MADTRTNTRFRSQDWFDNAGSDMVPGHKVHVVLMDRIRAGIREGCGIPMEFSVHRIQENGKRKGP